MGVPKRYSYTKYLDAKKSIDSRAINKRIWNNLSSSLPHCSKEYPMHVLEVGAGIGTMIERMLDRGLLKNSVYKAIDISKSCTSKAYSHVSKWALSHGFEVIECASDQLIIKGLDKEITVILEAIDLFDFMDRIKEHRNWDLLVAHAFLDLIDTKSALPSLLSLLKFGGLFYFTLNFDGITVIEPEIKKSFDDKIITLYHSTMNQRRIKGKRSGSSCTGRFLYSQLKKMNVELSDFGRSDWRIFPKNKKYSANESYFLHFIINTIYNALKKNRLLDQLSFEKWIKQRHLQIERGELIYIARQLDFLGKIPV